MSAPALDGARPVRADDAFDVERVAGWLHRNVEGLPAQPPEVRQFSAGASNLTYLLRYPDRDLVLRRPPRGTRAGTAHDMGREYEIQRRLRPHFPYVPQVHALCEDEDFGLFRLAGITQQLYHRYSTGATTNPRFRFYWLRVRFIHRRCLALIREAS